MRRRGILRIRTDMDESHVRVSFIDTGGGMSAETLSHVFEPYYTTKERGTGLGLLIVRRIVREHGGELAIESTEGKGLTLSIRLPFKEQRVRMLEACDRNPGSDETRGLRFCDQATQSRQSRNADCACAAIAPDGAGESHLAPANRRTLWPGKYFGRIARTARSTGHDSAGRPLFGECFDRGRKRHRQGTVGTRDS